jgi:hypothetical protein
VHLHDIFLFWLSHLFFSSGPLIHKQNLFKCKIDFAEIFEGFGHSLLTQLLGSKFLFIYCNLGINFKLFLIDLLDSMIESTQSKT